MSERRRHDPWPCFAWPSIALMTWALVWGCVEDARVHEEARIHNEVPVKCECLARAYLEGEG